MKIVNTPYDDVFRTLLNDCSSLIIPVINEVFGEHYTGKEKIVFAPNEHFINRQDGVEEEKITDTSFKVLGLEEKKYHWECQSASDNSMLIRFFEYDTQIALDEGIIEKNVLTVTFPHSAVLFLRCTVSTPDNMKIRIVTPEGDVCYHIQVMKMKDYSIDEIFSKKLFFLIPFYIFLHENRLEEYSKDDTKLGSLKEEYEMITSRLEAVLSEGDINEYTKCTIIDMSKKVLEHIAKKYKNVREGVESVMGGKILDYEAKIIKLEGRKEGKQEGRQEGKLELLIDLVNENIISLADAASKIKLSEEEFMEKMQEYRAD